MSPSSMKTLAGIVGDEFVERRRPGKSLVPLLRSRDEDFSVCRASKRVTICRLVYHKSPPFFYFASSLTHGF
jgi:hypothetical protein